MLSHHASLTMRANSTPRASPEATINSSCAAYTLVALVTFYPVSFAVRAAKNVLSDGTASPSRPCTPDPEKPTYIQTPCPGTPLLRQAGCRRPLLRRVRCGGRKVEVCRVRVFIYIFRVRRYGDSRNPSFVFSPVTIFDFNPFSRLLISA